jgi:hypothetical protein
MDSFYAELFQSQDEDDEEEALLHPIMADQHLV